LKITLDVPEFNEKSVDFVWNEKAKISLNIQSENEIELLANKEGLLCLAKQLIYFAHNDLSFGAHVHYDPFSCGDGLIGDIELIISKILD
jgi:hypothetical protein